MFTSLVVLALLAIASYLLIKGHLRAAHKTLRSVPDGVRGVFGTQTLANLQRSAAAEVMRCAAVAISGRFLPNDVLVLLHPHDYDGLGVLRPEFCQGVAELLDSAVQNGPDDGEMPFAAVGRVEVRVKADPRVFTGTVQVVASIIDETEVIGQVPQDAAKLSLDFGDQCFRLSGRSLIGRSQHADICIEGAGVSREHALIECVSGGVTVTDLGRANGTFLNGIRVRQATVSPGDRLSFGPLASATLSGLEVDAEIFDVTTQSPS